MTNPSPTHPVAIVGGGIAGLSVAWYLQRQGIPYVVLEQGDRWGGKILTERVDGFGSDPFVIEGGPDSFIAQKPWAMELAEELGLGPQLLGTNDHRRKVYVLQRGKPTPLPDGVLLIVPTKLMPFALSPLISPLGKLRMGLDLVIPPRRNGEDETLADFVRRRLGDEALDKIAEPLMSGIYNADAEQQSLLATFPRFRALEERYGSLTRGMLASRRSRSGALPSYGNGQQPPSRPRSAFITLRYGTGQLVQALVRRLEGDLWLNAELCALERTREAFALTLAGGGQLQASSVVLAVPAFVAADLVRPLASEAARLLSGIRYVSTGTISLAFREGDLPRQPDGFGLVIPRSEQRPLNAITWSSVKFNHRAPDGHLLLRAFFGGSRSPLSMALNDADLLETTLQELDSLCGIDAQPVLHRIYRWQDSNPQYDVGHLERVAAVEAALPPGLFVTGSPYRGVGLPDCVKQARDTACQVAQHLDGLVLAAPARTGQSPEGLLSGKD